MKLLKGPSGPVWSESRFAMLAMWRGVVYGGVSGEAYYQNPRYWNSRIWRLLIVGTW